MLNVFRNMELVIFSALAEFFAFWYLGAREAPSSNG